MTIKWGILGTGGIAVRMLRAIREEGGTVVAVGSSEAERARDFAKRHGVARWYAPHSDLLSDPEIEAVYVATTHNRHFQDGMACIEAGLPALIEKPLVLDADQAHRLTTAARQAGVFLMEAMWMRFQPGFLRLEAEVRAGTIGQPMMVMADFGEIPPDGPDRRWMSPELGGGSLLDMGIYPLTFAASLLGPPSQIRALATVTDRGIDTQLTVAMSHEGGALSAWASSFLARSGTEATVAGSGGALRLHESFPEAGRLTLRRSRSVTEIPVEGSGLGFRPQIRDVHRCLSQGAIESDRMPHDLSVSVALYMDEIRSQVGVEFSHLRG